MAVLGTALKRLEVGLSYYFESLRVTSGLRHKGCVPTLAGATLDDVSRGEDRIRSQMLSALPPSLSVERAYHLLRKRGL